MEEQRNRTVADTLNSRLKTPWVWLIVLITVGLTFLFYLSQKSQIMMCSRYIKAISDYELMEQDLLRSMDAVRCGFGADTMKVRSQSMSVRELAVSFSREMDEISIRGVEVPPAQLTMSFEREVFSKVAGMRRYMNIRSAWLEDFDIIHAWAQTTPESVSVPLLLTLDSARFGYAVSLPEGLALPDSLHAAVDSLLERNQDLSVAWARFDNRYALVIGEELVQFFQWKSLEDFSLKTKIPLVFYFLSLALLLSTFFFIFKSKN